MNFYALIEVLGVEYVNSVLSVFKKHRENVRIRLEEGETCRANKCGNAFKESLGDASEEHLVKEEGRILPFYAGTDPVSGFDGMSAMGGEDGGMDDVGAALESLQGSAPGPDGEAVAVPPEVLVRQKQAAQRRKAEEQAKQGEDLLMEMF